jgi:hypothetical protein
MLQTCIPYTLQTLDNQRGGILPDATPVPDSLSANSDTSGIDLVPLPQASCRRDNVLSMLLLLVLGLVIVVPKLGRRPCPRLNCVPGGEVGDIAGVDGALIEVSIERGSAETVGWKTFATPFSGASSGIIDCCETIALASSESTSKSSGGSRSFSISDFRLGDDVKFSKGMMQRRNEDVRLFEIVDGLFYSFCA